MFFLTFSGHEQLACCFYYESIIGRFKEPCSDVSCPFQQIQSMLSKVMITCSAWIGHFWVPLGLCIKTRSSVQPLIWKWIFIFMQIKLITQERLCTWPHFVSEGFWNPEVAYWLLHLFGKEKETGSRKLLQRQLGPLLGGWENVLIVDRFVPSFDPRNNCGTHWSSSSFLVFKMVNLLGMGYFCMAAISVLNVILS